MAVLFDPRVAATLLGHFAAAINGGSVARGRASCGRLGEQLFARGVTIRDDPLRRRGLRSRPFDGEGLRGPPGRPRRRRGAPDLVADSASARQLGIQPTGHAARGTGGAPGAGPSNMFLEAGGAAATTCSQPIPSAAGHRADRPGVNRVTGDYSRGAAGFMIRDGAIAEPVAEITIASNLVDMFATLEPGSDLEFRRGIDAPTVLVPEMTVGAA